MLRISKRGGSTLPAQQAAAGGTLSRVLYALRVVLPDRPGSLGAVASALGAAGVNIVSVDVVTREPGEAVDDLLVDLPARAQPDRVVTAAEAIDGVRVESIRPYYGSRDLRGDLDLVERMAAEPTRAVELLAWLAPDALRASWAMVVERGVVEEGADRARLVTSSAAAPEEPPLLLPWLPLARPAVLDGDAVWVPTSWRALAVELVAAPIGRADLAVLLGRAGGPAFREAEALRIGHLAALAAAVSH